MGLIDMTHQFRQCCWHRIKGCWTWRHRRRGQWVSLQCNYFITREGDCRRFRNVALWLPNHHNLDHQADVSTIYPGLKRHTKAYWKKRHPFPLCLSRYGPKTKLERLFDELCEGITPSPVRVRKANNWISNATWKLFDHRATLRRTGKLTQRGARTLGEEIKT